MKKSTTENLMLDKCRNLIGDYPRILDLRELEFDIEILSHLDQEFESAEKEGRLVQANVRVSENRNVEVIYFPYDCVGIDYAVIENLPNLTELIVCSKDSSRQRLVRLSEELKWLICRNLPKLKKITIGGGIKWLQIEKAVALETIDVGECKALSYFGSMTFPVKLDDRHGIA